MGRTVPISRKVVVPDAGHIIFAEKPTAFNQLVVEFIKGLQLES